MFHLLSLGQDLLIYFSYYWTSISICLSMFYCMLFGKVLSNNFFVLSWPRLKPWEGELCKAVRAGGWHTVGDKHSGSTYYVSHTGSDGLRKLTISWDTLMLSILWAVLGREEPERPWSMSSKASRKKWWLSEDLKLMEESSETIWVEMGWNEARDHSHGQKSRWKEAIVVACSWTRQGVVRGEDWSEISWGQSMSGTLSKARKAELSQHPCLTEEKQKDRGEMAHPRSQMENHLWKTSL